MLARVGGSRSRGRSRSQGGYPKRTRVQPVKIVRRSNDIVQLRKLPLPETFKASLRYCSKTISLDPGVAGIPGQQLFATNGLFDPDVSGTGHQPMGYDQFMAIYSTYTVTSSKITVYGFNKDTATSQILSINSGYDSAIIYADQAIEQGEGAWVHMGPRGSNREIVKVSNSWNLKKLSGDKAGPGDLLDSGTTGTNPSNVAFYNILTDPNNATNTGACDIFVVIDYFVTFTKPKQLVQS